MNQMVTISAQLASPVWSLLVVASGETAAQVRRVSLVGDDLEGFVHDPGQHVVLSLPTEKGALCRACPITGFDAEELRLDVCLPVAEDIPAARWADAARIGDAVTAALLGR
jgi:NADPH-dependent ferric siderophore reductase